MNSAQRYWGKTDVGLGAVGLRQVEQLRDRLATERIDHAYTSEMQRARLTTQIIASIHHIKAVSCPELREIDFGKIEGMNFEEVRIRYPEIASMWDRRDPGLVYPDGESLTQLDKRIAQFRSRLNRHAADEVILVVAHSGVLRTLICQLLGLETKHRWNLRLDLASLSIVDTYPDISILNLLNDTSHLTDKCK